MIPNKFAYFSHGSTYRTNKEGENISDNSIVFVEDDQSIATRGKIFGVRGVYPGTCTTAAGTAAKVATTSPLFPLDSNGKPLPGTTIAIKFSNTNSYKTAGTTMTLNVNSTGAYPIYYNNAEVVSTTSANTIACGYKNRYTYYIFNGTQWVWLSYGNDANTTYSNVALGQGYAIQNNESESDTVTATLSSYALTTGGIVVVKFIFDVPCVSGPTLNVNAKGAKAIYHNGSPLEPGIIRSGDLATFIYSTNYYLISLDRDFNDPVSVGTLNTNNSTAQTVNSSESFSSNINLHKVSKTGSYNDLLNKPEIPEDTHQIVILVGLQETPLVFQDWDGNSLTHEHVAEIFSDPSKTVILYDTSSDVTYRYFGLFEQYYFNFIAPYNGGISYVHLEVSNPSTGIITVREKGTVDYVPDTRKINNKRLSANITLTASDVGALPANTHIPVDPVNADWDATSGLAEILHKPTIVQSVSINGGSAISPTNGNVNLPGIVTGIYSGNQGLAPGNDGIITLPEKVIYGSLENGSFYSASYDIITQEWTLSETTTAGMIGKIYIDLYADPTTAYVWDGTRFSELSPSLSGFATESYVDSAINALPTPMVFKGTIGTGGTSATVPSNPTEGDTYKIISGGQSLTFSGITAGTIKVGDTVIYKNSTMGWVLIPSGDEPSGTVTSVNMTVPTGLSVSGNPITSSGTFNITYAAGYSIPTTAKQASWDQKQNAIEIIDLT